MVRTRLLGVAVAALLSGFGLAGPAANATTGCTPNFGTCDAGGSCSPNFGYCGSGASCPANTGRCVDDNYQSHGGCTFHANNQDMVTQPDTYVGVVAARVTTNHRLTPNPATVTCTVYVNGTPYSPLPWIPVQNTPVGVEAGAGPITFVAHAGDVVSLCTKIEYNSGNTPVDEFCGNAIQIQFPPQQVFDLLDTVFAALEPAFAIIDGVFTGVIDPNTCPTLASLHGTYGPITIGLDGDITIDPDPLGINPIDNCPPY
jgi:hypothetical protein